MIILMACAHHKVCKLINMILQYCMLVDYGYNEMLNFYNMQQGIPDSYLYSPWSMD